MGRDKARVELGGGTLLDRAAGLLARIFPEVLVVGREHDGDGAPGGEARARIRFVPDDEPGRGPLGGIATALAAADRPWVFVAACDMPFLDERLIARLREAVQKSPDALAVAPRTDGIAQPLAAFYRREALAPARRALEEGRLSVRRFLDDIGAVYVDLPPGSDEARALADIDTEADLAEAERRLARP